MKINTVHTNKKGCQYIVLEELSDRKLLIQWLDDYAYKMIVSKDNASRGAIRNPFQPSVFNEGFVGVGEYTTSKNGVDSSLSLIWRAILQRCFCPKFHEKHPTYIGCTIDIEWKNFQVFGAWYEANSVQGWDLDKDLLFKGNKHYSPQTCTFLPTVINTALIKSDAKRGKFPIGVSWHKASGKYIAQASNSYLGIYNSVEEAFMVYKKFKEQSLKILAA